MFVSVQESLLAFLSLLLFLVCFKPFLKIYLKEIFKGCCLLFSYQGSLSSLLFERQLCYSITAISLCQELFYFVLLFFRDSLLILPHRFMLCQHFFHFVLTAFRATFQICQIYPPRPDSIFLCSHKRHVLSYHCPFELSMIFLFFIYFAQFRQFGPDLVYFLYLTT